MKTKYTAMLQTHQLQLPETTLNELQLVHELHSLPETDEFNTLGIPENIGVTEKIMNDWLANQQIEPKPAYVFSIYLKDSLQFIGLMGLKMGKENYKTAEVWYKLHKDFWGKGLATEALNELLAFGFNELDLHRIEAGCAVENIGSIRVLEKVGMTREGRKRKKLPLKHGWMDNYFYAILEEDFLLK